MRVLCDNCSRFSNIEIPRGTAKEDVVDEIECPNCGVVGHCRYA